MDSSAQENTAFQKKLEPFLEQHCYECHDDVVAKGGLDLFELGNDLADPATFTTWARIYDRVTSGEMPPRKVKERPTADQLSSFPGNLAQPLANAHTAEKGTVLRRLNRAEYENTLNDIFGTNLRLAADLPEDAKSHEFDNVGEALSISMVQMQRYLDAINKVLDSAIQKTIAKPESKTIKANYATSKGLEKFIGDKWLRRPDGAIVFFQKLGYPTGMLREASFRTAGRYKIRVTGYAFQSDTPVTFSLGGTTFARAAERPTWGYFKFPPNKPTTIEIEQWVESSYMVQIEAMKIADNKYEIKNNGVANYKGPGLAILGVEVEGPIVDEFPSRGHKLIFGNTPRTEIMPSNPTTREKSWYVPKWEIAIDDPTAAAKNVYLRVAETAFRRPVTKNDIGAYLKLFEAEFAAEPDFEAALLTGIKAIFCSPDFLYLRENPGYLSNHALASRLSYFLNRTTPDEELLAAADSKNIAGDPAELLRQMNRLLENEKSERFINDFTDAWLDLRDIDFTSPDRNLFPEFDSFLQDSMIEETRTFFRELVTNNLPAKNAVRSEFAMLNNRLADHYQIEGVTGPKIRRVDLPAESPRGGFLSQGSVLKVSANGTNTSPVLRGAWVMERILGKTPPPPPPGIPGVEPDIRGAETLRQLLEKHRNAENCNACHAMIDPPGFALESFNPIGGWRDQYRTLGDGEKVDIVILGRRAQYKLGSPVDATGQLADERAFAGFNEFRDLLLADEDAIAKTLATKFLTFATGREMGFSDRPEINAIVKQSREKGHGFRDLLGLVVTSEIFRKK